MGELNVVAILYPRKGKADQLLQRLLEVAQVVKEQEPGTLEYEINRVIRPAKDGTEEIVLVERSVQPIVLFTQTTAINQLRLAGIKTLSR
jgi:hypothetical protein